MQWLSDDIDFRAYERQTEAKAKVRPASVFAEDLAREFALPDPNAPKAPTTFAGRLKGNLEFLPGEITVWAGYSGHRKSMFTGQVAMDLVAQDQRVLVASLEMLPARTLSRMVRQACAKRFPGPRDIERFTRWTDGRLWLFDHVGRLSPEFMLAVCKYFGQELAGQHVFIDSMMMVCASEEHLDEQKQFATDVVRTAQETGMHVHLVAHCRKPSAGEGTPPSKYDVRGSAAITDQAHNVVTVWANKSKVAKLEIDPNDLAALDEMDAGVEVHKQRSGVYEGKAKLFFDDSSLRFTGRRMEPVEPYPMEAV